MNVLFVNYDDFSSNSAIHIFNFANQLMDLGVDCGVCVPRNKRSVKLVGEPKFAVYEFADLRKNGIRFRDGRAPDIIHAWTPREVVRKFMEKLTRRYGSKCVVHMEDNEEVILRSRYHLSTIMMHEVSSRVIDRIIDKQFSHPVRYKHFLEQSDGITVITERLLEFKPDGVPGKVIWPGYEEHLFGRETGEVSLKQSLGIPEGTHVVVYSGNTHQSNRLDVYSLYLAIAVLNRRGIPMTLVRTGRDYVEFRDAAVNTLNNCYIELGFVDRRMLPKIMSLADVFIQPGAPDEFNNYRFPSKLPEFFAMGKPVILPDANIAESLSDGFNCLILKKGSSIEICEKVEFLIENPEIGRQIGANGAEFARKNFSWIENSSSLYKFYRDVLNQKETNKGRSRQCK